MRLLILIITPFLLFGCNKTIEKDGGLKIEMEFIGESSQSDKEYAIELIKQRLINLSNSKPDISLKGNTIDIELPLERDKDLYEKILLSRGKFEINKAYTLTDLYEAIKRINDNNLLYDEAIKDSINLFSILQLNVNDKNEPLDDPIVGFSAVRDTMLVSKILRKSHELNRLSSDLSFRWDFLESYGQLALYAISAKSIVSNSMLKPIKNPKSPAIHLKQEFANSWFEFTNNNKGEYVAISIDNRVFSYPKIGGAIENGTIYQYSGISLSDRVWLFITPLIKEDLFNSTLKMNKIEYVSPPVEKKESEVSVTSEQMKKIFNSKVYLMLSLGESNNSYHKHLHMFNQDGVDFFPIYTSEEDIRKTEMVMPQALPFDGILVALTVKENVTYKINYGLETEVEVSGKAIKNMLSTEIEKYKTENKDLLEGIEL